VSGGQRLPKASLLLRGCLAGGRPAAHERILLGVYVIIIIKHGDCAAFLNVSISELRRLAV
jgi:hypothetical protein